VSKDVISTIVVPCITLDDVSRELKTIGIGKVDVIKIDVEGAEIEVLKGAKNLLESDKPILIIEVLNDINLLRVKNMLKRYGYKIMHIENRNFLFYPNKLA